MPESALPAGAFPGCTPRRVPRREIDTWEGRLEFWDAATETAWVAEPTTPYHEKPSRRLTALMDRIAAERGSAVVCYGSMDLMQRDERGAPRRILQADESVYVHPRRARLPGPKAMMAGEDDFPDVVLEVDHTTDVRRAKLGLYEAWGFPEVWVEVPEQGAASRPRRRRSGTDDPPAGGGRLPGVGHERRVSGLDGGRDPRRPERVGTVGTDVRGAAPGRRGARRAGRHRAGRRSDARLAPA